MDLSSLECLGFYINKQMKWTFKSHKGFFVPVMYGDEIKGLRIHLEEKYKLDTTDIWFSSANEYQGASASNNIMIFMPETERMIKVYNSNEFYGKDVVIASDILMGYKLFNRDKKITIAIPNRISKSQGKKIINSIDINSADIYIDEHTIKYDYRPIYNNLLNYIPEDRKTFNFIFDYKELIKEETNASFKRAA